NSGAKTATATAELLERQNINIKPHGKHLTISVHLKHSENHKKGGYTVQQHFYGKSSRLWRLHHPAAVQAEAFHAMMENGMVTVRFIA
ncbi:uncharacterized protein HD556DRAFT_1369032, partial [Suillus plorans]